MATKLKNITNTVDIETGHLVEQSKTFSVRADSTQEFYMTFLEFMSPFYKIKSITDVQVLAKLCSLMEFNKNEVYITTARREDVCKELDIKTTHLSNSIKRLKDLKLIAGERGTYRINPKIYWKGTTDERNKLLKEKGLEVKLTFKAQQ